MITKPLHLDVNEKIECAETLASRFRDEVQELWSKEDEKKR